MAMSKPLKIILFSIGGFIGLFVLLAATLMFFVDANAYKPRVEAAASAALGMEVKVGGQLGIGFFPGMLLTMKDVHIRNRGRDLVAAEKVRLGLDLLPLLQNEYRITKILLLHPKITIERNVQGKYNFENPQAAATLPVQELAKISLSDGTLLYADKQSGEGFDAGDCSLDVHHLLFAGGDADTMKNLSFTAELACGKIQTKDYTVSDLKFSANGSNGVYDLKSVTMGIFGGQGSGSIRADFAGSAPRYHVRYTLRQFRIGDYFKTRSPQKVAEGPMDFTANLSMQGKTVNAMTQSANGEASLRGDNITFYGHDLDLELSRFESSQNFNLVDVGAFFFAGPVGLAVTKGYNFATLFKGSGGVSTIRTLVSNWKVERGVMQAQDVAMATDKHRIALQGGLDFVNGRFADVIVALIDSKGCAEVRQKISGPFEKPVVEQPNIIKSLAGPALKLLKKGRKLLSGGECAVIYAGSVAPPH